MDSIADWVDPLIGTDSTRDFSSGNVLPLVSLPFGMTGWIPQSDTSPWLYQYRQRKLGGFRATHQPSPWMGDYGHFTLMPQTGPLELAFSNRASVYRHDQTTIKPFLLRTWLDRYEIGVSLAATERGAVFYFDFPRQGKSRLIFDLPIHTHLAYDPARRRLEFSLHNHSGGAPHHFGFHAVLQFKGIRKTEFRVIGEQAVLEFVDKVDRAEVRIGTSFISREQAAFHLEREIGDKKLPQIANLGRAAWNNLLGRVTLGGADEAQKRTFYTALYRTLIFPRKFHEPTPKNGLQHFSPFDGKVHDGVLYTDTGFWDTYRNVYPLFAFLYPDLLGEIIQGWINAFLEGGWFPKWASPGYRICMIGTHIDAVIACAVSRGIDGFDLGDAYEGIRKNAFEAGDPKGAWGREGLKDYLKLGYLPADRVDHSCAATQEYAFSDFCIAQVARLVGQDRDHEELLRRALNYRHVFDPRAGFMRGRNA
ncbi:MAG TPA: glycoside hydrolase domain-containing protein, partial [Chthoniobacterales bacterium]